MRRAAVILLLAAIPALAGGFNRYEEIVLARVVDGDTLRLTIHLGFNIILYNESFRLAGIDAPEMGTAAGKKSKAELESYLKGKELSVEVGGRDKYGRWLVILYADKVNVNEWLVEQGLARRMK